MVFLLQRNIRYQIYQYLRTGIYGNHNMLRTFSQFSSSSALEQQFAKVRRCLYMFKYLKVSEFEKLFDDVKYCSNISSEQALTLLHSCSGFFVFEDSQSRRQLTKNVWDFIMELDLSMDQRHFEYLLEAHIDNDAVVTTDEFLAVMKSKNVKPTIEIYNKLVYYFCKYGNVDECLKLIDMMRQDSIPIVSDAYRFLLIGSLRANDEDKHARVKSIINENKVRFAAGTITNSLVKIYAEQNNFPKVKNVIESEGEHVKNINSKSIFEAYVQFKGHQNQEATDWLWSIIPRDEPIHLVAPYILRLTKLGEYEAANKIVDMSDTPLNFHRYFLPMLVKHAPLKVTWKYCCNLQRTGIMPKAVVNLIRILASDNNLSDTLTIFNEMKSNLMTLKPSLLYPIIDSLDPLHPTFRDDLLEILKFDDGSCSILYSSHVFPILDNTDTLKTFRSLVSNFSYYNVIHFGCLHYILGKNNLKEALEFLKATSGLRRCYPDTLLTIARIFSHNLHLIDEMAQMIAFVDSYSRSLERDRGVKKEMCLEILCNINSELQTADVPNKDEVILQLLTAIEKLDVKISESDTNTLTRLQSFKASKTKEVLQKMQSAYSTDSYIKIVDESTKRINATVYFDQVMSTISQPQSVADNNGNPCRDENIKQKK